MVEVYPYEAEDHISNTHSESILIKNGKRKKQMAYGDYTSCLQIQIISALSPVFQCHVELFLKKTELTKMMKCPTSFFHCYKLKNHTNPGLTINTVLQWPPLASVPSSSFFFLFQSSLNLRDLEPWPLWVHHFQEMSMYEPFLTYFFKTYLF